MRSLIFFPCALFISIEGAVYASNQDTVITKTYPIIVMDSPAQLFSMRQMNQDYLSLFRIFSREVNTNIRNEKVSDFVQLIAASLLFMPITHEEGHRSILTAENIGCVSKPYFNSQGAAYVTGVNDKTLMDLRDRDLPTYIRLHTSGLESDYMLTNRVETLGAFEMDEFRNLRWEYWVRKLAILQYYLSGLFRFDVGIKEESNELERDIVGYDTYGAVRHLFRPTMNFYRYTSSKDLTDEEKHFVNRTGYRSLLNILNPMLIGKRNFHLGINVKFNAGFGYTMAPFGDFIDENIWLMVRNKYNIQLYFREYQNKDHWFPAGGVSLVEYSIIDRLSTNIEGHFWKEPKSLDFRTSNTQTGGAVDLDLKYHIRNQTASKITRVSMGLGFIYKTRGFLPEEDYMDDHFGLRVVGSIDF